MKLKRQNMTAKFHSFTRKIRLFSCQICKKFEFCITFKTTDLPLLLVTLYCSTNLIRDQSAKLSAKPPTWASCDSSKKHHVSITLTTSHRCNAVTIQLKSKPRARTTNITIPQKTANSKNASSTRNRRHSPETRRSVSQASPRSPGAAASIPGAWTPAASLSRPGTDRTGWRPPRRARWRGSPGRRRGSGPSCPSTADPWTSSTPPARPRRRSASPLLSKP